MGKGLEIHIPRDYTRKRVFGSEQEYGILVRQNAERHNDLEGVCWCCWGLVEGFLENGGRIYADCYHPEYASPEASNPLEAVVYDKAGETIVRKRVYPLKGSFVRFFKNNTDGIDSYGCHESYSTRRTDLRVLGEAILPFLLTRIIYAGAGSINKEGEFELSQKARFIIHSSGRDTTHDRAIFNTRDESLTQEGGLMRVHIISGDANLSEFALFLKYGTTGLVLDLFEDGKLKPLVFDYVSAFHAISKDPSLKAKVKTSLGELSALEMQSLYLERAESELRGRDSMTNELLDRWRATLNILETNPMQLDRQLDWVIKKRLIDSYMQRKGVSMTDASVRDIDLRYHELGNGFFYMLQKRGLVDRLVSDEEIEHAIDNPPEDTRAFIRAMAIEKGWGVNWSFVTNKKVCNECERHCTKGKTINLDNPLHNYSELQGELLKSNL